MRRNCQHCERHIPNAVRVRRIVFALSLLPPARAAEVGAVNRLQLVDVVVLGALWKRADGNDVEVGWL